MIINFYVSDQHTRLLDQLKLISEEKKRSVSYIIREALESYVTDSLSPRRGKNKKEAKR
ncbi:MAG: ribbon-helix-helix protein, CopG family [Candidatus Firestonebacteria bacterium]|nr:ribbon-helix-helix protein, CopG family [Candidatus Firestonebacteria bacterium]